MRLGIMQPYFLPYLGYFQLIHAVDAFVLYDNIQFVKKGWIHRNRMLLNGAPAMFTLPLASASDYLDICERCLSDTFAREGDKLLRRLQGAYRKAPFFEETMPLLNACLGNTDPNLFAFLHHSIRTVLAHLGIATPVRVSSDIDMDHSLKREKRVIAMCKVLGATEYVNPPGGMGLYDSRDFAENGLRLSFLIPSIPEYTQLGKPFVANLSVLDALMFGGRARCRQMLDNYSLRQDTVQSTPEDPRRPL